MAHDNQTYTAFAGSHRVAMGDLATVATKAKAFLDQGESASILILDDETCRVVEVDFRGTADDVVQRLELAATKPEPRGPGRPKLGVVAREVTLLPRHWEWLNAQPGGASVALRKLVEEARRSNESKDRVRQAQETLYRFMSTLAGDEAGFEEASRALFAGDRKLFMALTRLWPKDIRDHAERLAISAFTPES
ncbi:DUF2239 family protein [Microvirga terrestris]|uniref:DUF2239 family protein n=1 Tax=Microvirga terrestris TaxID=2791024 RepID=A0ABS0HTG1_9HYPH|nr:DUF2239 family protein [Microvirga terrestris]MBF9196472.1 DUF2239 family protein [Microvirga terrestris]